MAIKLYTGILIDGGAIAVDDACCCGGDDCDENLSPWPDVPCECLDGDDGPIKAYSSVDVEVTGSSSGPCGTDWSGTYSVACGEYGTWIKFTAGSWGEGLYIGEFFTVSFSYEPTIEKYRLQVTWVSGFFGSMLGCPFPESITSIFDLGPCRTWEGIVRWSVGALAESTNSKWHVCTNWESGGPADFIEFPDCSLTIGSGALAGGELNSGAMYAPGIPADYCYPDPTISVSATMNFA